MDSVIHCSHCGEDISKTRYDHKCNENSPILDEAKEGVSHMDQVKCLHSRAQFIPQTTNMYCKDCDLTWESVIIGSELSSILDEAKEVLDDRRKSYGSPRNNLNITQRLWNAWLDGKYLNTGKGGFKLDAQDVAMMQILLKISREANEPKRDNLVDICGWAECYMECIG